MLTRTIVSSRPSLLCLWLAPLQMPGWNQSAVIKGCKVYFEGMLSMQCVWCTCRAQMQCFQMTLPQERPFLWEFIFLRPWDFFLLGGVSHPLLCFCASSLPSTSCHCRPSAGVCFSFSPCFSAFLLFCFSAFLIVCFSACSLLTLTLCSRALPLYICLFSACSCL